MKWLHLYLVKKHMMLFFFFSSYYLSNLGFVELMLFIFYDCQIVISDVDTWEGTRKNTVDTLNTKITLSLTLCLLRKSHQLFS
ncbi:hypothetical protein BCR42DRAFT_420925 [Absidia repens]|uniref:Uncharacterized protein n=1 Tax=Absidia repens TaxID=90262 RepID=A0A1X2I8Z3_9FUNG|nr:hypothetical protein BCR42DRAFT_420925 [Absidia repens]